MDTSVRYVPANEPVPSKRTRLGGQPAWIEAPQWPVSQRSGEQMWFIGQFELSAAGEPVRLAYVFMTNAAGYADDAWEYDAGENAVIIQPGGTVPDFVNTVPIPTGPTCGAVVIPEAVADPDPNVFNRIGGLPVWIQTEDTLDDSWQFVAQLDSRDLPFEVNFGDIGSAYVFVDPDLVEGRFFWQGC